MASCGTLQVIRWITSEPLYAHSISSIVSSSLIGSSLPIFEAAFITNIDWPNQHSAYDMVKKPNQHKNMRSNYSSIP